MRSAAITAIVFFIVSTSAVFGQPPRFGPRPGGDVRPAPLPSESAPPTTATKAGQAATSQATVLAGDRSIIVNLSKGVDVNRIVKFISEQTGKPVIKDKDVQGKITVYSAEKVPKEEALQLIYDALDLSGIAVIETPRVIKLVTAEKAKTLQVPILEAGESASSLTNKTQVVQKVFKLKITSPKGLAESLKPLLGKNGEIGVDERTKTLVITDTASNIVRFERLVSAFDRVEEGQIVLRVFKLEYANAEDMAGIVATMAVAGEGGGTEIRSSRGQERYYERRYGRRGAMGGQIAGDVVVIPDVRTNWLVVAGPPDKISQIEKLVKEMDVPGRSDAQIHVIDIKHADAYDVANDIRDVFQRKISREKQEVLEVRSSSRGNQLLILATPQTFKLVEEMVKKIDTPEAVQRETRTYPLKYMDATDMADQLNQLYQEGLGGYGMPWFFRSRGGSQNVRFVPSVRTNSLMVIAPPSEYEFIEEMIKELDVEVPEQNLAPRVYHITHTDASEMADVLTELFEGSTSRRTGRSSFFFWRPRGRTTGQEGVGALYGKVRFVVYRNTNSIVAITNNPHNFDVIDKLIKELDVLDPEATNMLVIQLQHADAAELANNLNNLLSEGAVARTGQTSQRTPSGTQNQQTPAPVSLVFPWQSAQRRARSTAQQEERPINTLIGQVRIVPDVRSQKLIIAAPSIYFDSLKKLVEDLDKPEPQVQLETYIVRVETEKSRRLGWRWTPDPSTISPDELDNAMLALADMGFIDTFAGGNSRGGLPSPVSISGRTVTDAFRGNQLFSYSQTLKPGKGVLSADVNLGLLLQLLIKNRDARVIAHPQITVNNNEEGEIFVGESVPFESGSIVSTEGRSAQTTVQYQDVGTRLTITPKINKQGRVVLTIKVDNSRREAELLGGRIVTERQTYDTKLTLEDGQTVWLGGLSDQRQDNVVRRFPVLGYIPYIGVFFRKTDKVTLESTIYAFVHPTVIMNPEDADVQFDKAKRYLDKYMEEYEGLEIKLPPSEERTTPTLSSRSAAGLQSEVVQLGSSEGMTTGTATGGGGK